MPRVTARVTIPQDPIPQLTAVVDHHEVPHDANAEARDAAWRAELRRYARETARATRAAQGLMHESQAVIELDADPQ